MSKFKIINGDITEFPDNIKIIVQGCNIHGIQGAGLALSLSQKYPQVLASDRAFRNAALRDGAPEEYLLGKYSLAKILFGDEYKYVVNLYQQKLSPCLSGVNFDYNAFWAGLNLFFKNTASSKPCVIGFPYIIGAGLAGGDGEIILKMIEEASKGSPHEIVFVKFTN